MEINFTPIKELPKIRKRGKYQALVEQFLKSDLDMVRVDGLEKNPNYVRVRLLKYLPENVRATVIGGNLYLIRDSNS